MQQHILGDSGALDNQNLAGYPRPLVPRATSYGALWCIPPPLAATRPLTYRELARPACRVSLCSVQYMVDERLPPVA